MKRIEQTNLILNASLSKDADQKRPTSKELRDPFS